MTSRTLPFALLTASTFLLAACHQLHSITEVRPDGSGELRTEVGFTAEERQNLEDQSGGSQDFCNTQQATSDATVTEEQRGGETWCITTRKFADLDELKRLYTEQKGVTVNRLEIAGGKFYYDVDVDTSSPDSGLANVTALTWTVTLPGTPITHNAAQVEGKTLVWTLAPKSGTVNLRAESEAIRPDSSLPLLPLALGGVMVLCLCGVALLGGVGAFFLLRRSRQPPARAG